MISPKFGFISAVFLATAIVNVSLICHAKPETSAIVAEASREPVATGAAALTTTEPLALPFDEQDIRPDDPLLGLKTTRNANGSTIYFTPRAATPVVYLHGMCGHPMHMCPWLRDALPNDKLAMVCPSAATTCGEPGAFTWRGAAESNVASVGRALDATGHADGSAILVGFSQGGYLSADLMRLRKGRYRAAWIVGAAPSLDARTLRAAGVERIVLSAGDFDGTAERLRVTTKELRKSGFSARYVSLGKVGHAFPLDGTKPTPKEVIAWLDDGTDWASGR